MKQFHCIWSDSELTRNSTWPDTDVNMIICYHDDMFQDETTYVITLSSHNC